MAKKKLFDKLGTWFTKVFNDVFGDDFGDELITDFKSWLKGSTGGGATNRDKELADMSLENQQILNDEEFERKKEWWELYESPSAKVRQYSDAGLNPMLLAGGGASVSATGGIGSAGSAPASSAGNPFDIFQTAMQLGMYKAQKKAILADVQKTQNEADAVAIENRWKERLRSLEAKEKEQTVEVQRTQGLLNMQVLARTAADTRFAEIYAEYAPDLFEAQLSKTASDIQKNTSEVGVNESQVKVNAGVEKLNEALATKAKVDTSLSAEQIKEVQSKVKRNEAEIRQINSVIAKIRHEIELIGSQVRVNDQEVLESQSRIQKYNQEVRLMFEQIGFTKLEQDYYIWNHSKDVSNSLGAGVKVHKEMFANDPRASEWKD